MFWFSECKLTISEFLPIGSVAFRSLFNEVANAFSLCWKWLHEIWSIYMAWHFAKKTLVIGN